MSIVREIEPSVSNSDAIAGAGRKPRRWERYDSLVSGLTEYWYPIALASTVRRKRKITQRLAGQDILLVFDQGKFSAIHNECPHRMVPLSLGSQEFSGHIACAYHGWVFNLETGRLAAALPDGPDSPITGKVCVRVYPLEERFGILWVWTGTGKPVPVERDIPEELLRGDARIYPLLRPVKGNWRYAGENGFDEAHGKVLHRPALWTAFRGIAAWNATKITTSEDGLWLNRYQEMTHIESDYPEIGTWPKPKFWQRSRKGKPRTIYGQSDHYVSVRLPCILRVRQPGSADWTHYDWYTPVDEDNYLYLALAVSWRPKGWRSLVWGFRFWTYILWIHHYLFNGQDLKMVGLMKKSAPSRAFRPDVSIYAWRKLVEEHGREPDHEAKPMAPNQVFDAF